MPSFNHLLVLAVLALTLSVRSAPVPDAAGADLGLVRGSGAEAATEFTSVDEFENDEEIAARTYNDLDKRQVLA
ncbi:hypothetical protein LXA43DRAFT_1102523 [Ganoderma leucocontextum]|nr:hypothetical protein LXA43DRAFT_1102523 [Ganoderma leucocontextum]